VSQGKRVFIFLGPPGSGKGSLSKLCVNELGWEQLSTGNLCREHISNQTEIGKKIDFAIKSGKLVSDGLIVEMVKKWLDECLSAKECVILDGFPRTLAQAEALDVLLKERFSFSDLSVVKLVIEDEKVVARLSGRYICQNDRCQEVYSLIKGSSLAPRKHMVCDACLGPLMRRSDDNKDSVKERLRTYHRHENKLLSFFETQGQAVTEFCVDKPLDVVFDNFKALVGLDRE